MIPKIRIHFGNQPQQQEATLGTITEQLQTAYQTSNHAQVEASTAQLVTKLKKLVNSADFGTTLQHLLSTSKTLDTLKQQGFQEPQSLRSAILDAYQHFETIPGMTSSSQSPWDRSTTF